MDFELTEDQKLLQQAVREFAAKEFTLELGRKCEETGEYPWELLRKCGKQGYLGMMWPPEYGGQGLSFLDSMIVLHELARAEPTLATALIVGSIFGADNINFFGTHEQKAEWLPRLARGEILSCGCFTEPAGGSDISRVLDTKAMKDERGWVISGTKTFITNGTVASVFVVLAQTDPSAVPPYKGQTQFVIGKCAEIEAHPLGRKMGFHMLPTAEVLFNNVRATDRDILGGPKNLNRGFYLTLQFLDFMRIELAFAALGTAEAALDQAIRYSNERTAFGRKISGFQALAHRIVDIAIKVELAKNLCYKGAWLAERARKDPSLLDESIKLASMAKVYATHTGFEACDLAIDVMGGYGYVESDVERWFRFVKYLEIVEGTKEIQRNTIARYVLGKEAAKYF